MTGRDDVDTLIDTANRFERSLDHQVQALNDIDNKAEHITRLLGILIGALLSVLAVAVRINNGRIHLPTLPLSIMFVCGLLLLILAMIFSIITYLSSRFKIGLHYRPARLLSQEDYDIEKETHYRRIIGTYGYNLERNKEVIQVNSRRFRRALVSLMGGVVFLSASGISFVVTEDEDVMWLILAVTVIFCAITIEYILAGRYLTLDDQP